MKEKIRRGAKIIVEDWMRIQPGESVLIITDSIHKREMLTVEKHARKRGATVKMRLLPSEKNLFNRRIASLLQAMLAHRVIIGATHNSMITTEAVKQAVKNGSRYLSLPLATNDGRSLLAYDFLTMDTDKSRFVAKVLLEYINQSTYLRVETPAGTNLKFRKAGRKGSYFNGIARDGRGFTSSSFEVYVPVEEDQTQGEAVVDGSLGYLGKVRQHFRILLEGGRLAQVEQNEDGKRLSAYVEEFQDDRLYHVSEFGIGLNFYARCEGYAYIEDESAYGTFHIGFGRNVALGGNFEANGHFDIVFLEPTIYADNRMIMENGIIIPAVPQVW